MGVFVIYAYVLVTILTGIAAMMKGAVLPGIAGIVGGGMSAWAESGLKGSLVVGDAGQRIAGALMAALFVSAGTGLSITAVLGLASGESISLARLGA
jgi:hypothetical protein